MTCLFCFLIDQALAQKARKATRGFPDGNRMSLLLKSEMDHDAESFTPLNPPLIPQARTVGV